MGCKYCAAGLTRYFQDESGSWYHYSLGTGGSARVPCGYTDSSSTVPDNSYEQAIVDKYSTPGLRRTVLTRYAKRHQLEDGKTPPAEIKKILAELYGDA